jgi:uncharacterized protein (DUF2147 family)
MLVVMFWAVLTPAGADQNSAIGLWQSFDDQGKPTGYIRISEEAGVLKGVIERGLPTDEPDQRCTECKGERKDRRMLGMDILWGLRKQGEEYSGGEILDPFSGNIYRAKLSLLENGTRLKVRGYVGVSLFGRTQIWKRAE